MKSDILKSLGKQDEETKKKEEESDSMKTDISKPTDGFEANRKKRKALQKVLEKLKKMNDS